jgi:hypothetical protein
VGGQGGPGGDGGCGGGGGGGVSIGIWQSPGSASTVMSNAVTLGQGGAAGGGCGSAGEAGSTAEIY